MTAASTKRRLWLLLALPGALGPLAILGFIVYTESAHDEARCAYVHVTDRPVGEAGAVVREERRRCLPEVEERRYSLVRSGRVQVLGRRRFGPSAFAGAEYAWDAGVSDAGEVHVTVRNPGHAAVEFREGSEDQSPSQRSP